MGITLAHWKGKLEVRQSRERYGCDLCKLNPPTEAFVGMCGSLLWICEPCIKKLQEWRETCRKLKGTNHALRSTYRGQRG